MKNIFLLMLLNLMLMTGLAWAADLEVQTGSHFDWWDDNRGADARQLYFPLRISGSYNDFSTTILTAYTDTHLDTPAGDASLGTFVDTRLINSYAILGKLPVDILLGLDLNIPTGKTNLSARQLALMMDPDLISINNYGEGFNVNPTLTVAGQHENWVGGIGLGYVWRGSYDFSSEVGLTDYDPGEIYSLSGEVRHYFSSALHARLFARHVWYATDTLRGEDFFRQGEFTLVGVGGGYSRSKWQGDAILRGIFRDKSKLRESDAAFAVESYDFQGDEYILNLDGRYFFDERTVVKGLIEGRYFTENDYPGDSPLFVGTRTKISGGFGVARGLGRHLQVGIDLLGFYKHDDRQNFPVVRQSRDFKGLSANLALTGSF